MTVEHLVRGDRGDLDGRRSEVEDRDPILATRTAAEPNDETGRLGHDGRDVTTVVVLAAAAARDLLEMADELIDPTHASPTTQILCLSTDVVHADVMAARYGGMTNDESSPFWL